MSRIVAVGCSFTFGQYLDHDHDISHPDYFTPSLNAWPQLVADHFGWSCKNLAFPGASPRYVSLRILEHEWEPRDVCVILWPSKHRHHIIGNLEQVDQDLGRTDLDCSKIIRGAEFYVPQQPRFRRWWKRGYSNTADRCCDSWSAKHLARLVLAEHGVPVVEYDVDQEEDHPDFATAWIPRFPNWKQCYIDRARDGEHPGKHSQHLIAEEYIRRLSS